VIRNAGSGFASIDDAGIAAADAVNREQNSLVACEPLCSEGSSTEVGTFIKEESSWFGRLKGTFGWSRPNPWGAVGREEGFGSSIVSPRSAAAWVVGVGRHGTDQVPSSYHYRVLRKSPANIGYFSAPSGAVRRFDGEGNCSTVSGSSVAGC